MTTQRNKAPQYIVDNVKIVADTSEPLSLEMIYRVTLL